MIVNVNPTKRTKVVHHGVIDPEVEVLNKLKKIEDQISNLIHDIYKNLKQVPVETTRHSFRELKNLRNQYFDLAKEHEYDTAEVFQYGYLMSNICSYLDLHETNSTIEERLAGKRVHVIKNKGFVGNLNILEIKIQGQFFRFLVDDKQNAKKLAKKVEEAVEKQWNVFQRAVSHSPGCHTFPKECGLPPSTIYKPIFNLEKLQELVLLGQFKQLNAYFISYWGYSWFIEEMLFLDNSNLTKDQLSGIFLKCLDYPELLGRTLLHYCNLNRLDIAKAAINFALKTEQDCDLRQVLRHFPSLLPTENTSSAALQFIKFGHFWHAQQVIEKGNLNPTMVIAKYDPIYGSRKETTLGNFWRALSKPYYYASDNSSKFSPDSFLNFLLSRGLIIEAESEFTSEDIVCSSLLEAVLKLSEKRNCPVLYKVFIVLLKNDPEPNPSVIAFLISRKGELTYRSFLNILVNRRIITESDLESLVSASTVSKGTLSSELKLAHCYIQYLENYFHISGLHQERLDLPLMNRIRFMKKKLKTYLDNHRIIVLKTYQKLSLAYDRVVASHIELNQLKTIGKEFCEQAEFPRHERKFSVKLIRFVGLFTATAEEANVTKKIHQCMDENCKDVWNDLYSKVVNLSERVKSDAYLSTHFISWCHGSSSKNLPNIVKSGELLSMGDIMMRNELTFGGEHCGSEKDGINKNYISGETLSDLWEDLFPLYDNVVSRFLMTYYYATKAQSHLGKEIPFDPFIARERLTIENIKKTLDIKTNSHWHGLFVRFYFDILRLRATSFDLELKNKLSEIRKFLSKSLTERDDDREIAEIKFLLNAIDSPLNNSFNQYELATILDPRPYGVIFASTTAIPRPLGEEKVYEYMLKSPVSLLEEIQVIFTQANRIDEIKQKFKKFKIKYVYDFDVGFYLEWRSIVRGERRYQFLDKYATNEVEDYQKWVAYALQNEILPTYTNPFPKVPTYKPIYSKPKVPLPNPYFARNCASHEEYLEKVKANQIVAREIHGPMHACRTTISTQIILNLFDKFNWKIVGNLAEEHCLLLGAAHDIMRQDEQEDHWTSSSAKWAKAYLNSIGADEVTADGALISIGLKDPNQGYFRSMNQAAVHDADVLEILRCLPNPSEFRKSELYISRKLPKDQLDELVEDYRKFVYMTESLELKLYLERSVENHYAELMQILDYFVQRGILLAIGNLLKTELSAFRDRPVKPEVLVLLNY